MGIDFGITEVIAIAGLAASAIGTGISMMGQMQAAQAQKQAADYQAQVALNNAEIAKNQAKQTAAAGEQQTNVQQMKTRQQVGAIRAAQAASNIDVDTGSAVDVRSSAAELGQLNALTTRSNAANKSYGYQVQASSDTAQAGLDTQRGNQATTGGMFGAAGSLLSGAGGFAKQYGNWNQVSGGNPSGNGPGAWFGNTEGDLSNYTFTGA